MHQNINDVGFDQFWQVYPKHVAKLDAMKAWKKISPDSSLLADILTALKWQTKQPGWQERVGGVLVYVPHPATWLRAGRWMDDAPLAPAMTIWTCPHTPQCHTSAFFCHQRFVLEAARAERAAEHKEQGV